jgi:PIN domain nuclease of toxin-antitoxin system
VRYLLDTHALVWAVDAPEKLSAKCRKILLDGSHHPVGLSAISLWEIAHKAAAGKLQLSQPLAAWIAAATRSPFVEILPLDERVAVESAQLPGSFHRDPADRIIVATARLHGLVLMTKDDAIRNYPPVTTVWD